MEYYTYAYLREDGTPYYIGKGKRSRVYYKYGNGIRPPKDKSRIIFLKQNLTEEEAFKHEIYMIAVFGRKDLGTGILRNRTNGGEGISGLIKTTEHKRKIRQSLLGRPRSQETKDKISAANSGKKRSKEVKEKIGAIWSNWWKITFDDDSEIIIFGLSTWCKNENYHKGSMLKVASGKQKRHKNVVKVVKLG